jgi:hypothetical protein
VLNAATGKGNTAQLFSRFRHWGAPVAANPAHQLLEKDDTAPN